MNAPEIMLANVFTYGLSGFLVGLLMGWLIF